MESEEFVADEVVSWGESGGDGGCPLESLEDVVGSPVGTCERRSGHTCGLSGWKCDGGKKHTLLVDLEPSFA